MREICENDVLFSDFLGLAEWRSFLIMMSASRDLEEIKADVRVLHFIMAYGQLFFNLQ
jgi:hypothetical protein